MTSAERVAGGEMHILKIEQPNNFTSTGLWGCNLPSPGILGKASAISGAQLAT